MESGGSVHRNWRRSILIGGTRYACTTGIVSEYSRECGARGAFANLTACTRLGLARDLRHQDDAQVPVLRASHATSPLSIYLNLSFLQITIDEY